MTKAKWTPMDLTPSCYYDMNDRETWFQDEALTIRATRIEDVRYIKNKAGAGYLQASRDGDACNIFELS